MVELKTFNSFVSFNNVNGLDGLLIKHPLLICSLLLARHTIPDTLNQFLLQYSMEIIYDLM